MDEFFLADFKRLTETRWRTHVLDSSVFGFQFQRGTRWLPGLPDEEIEEYQQTLRMQFPEELKALLRRMNGTDLPTVNVYGTSGHPPRYSSGVYSYPADLQRVRDRIRDVEESRTAIEDDLNEQGYSLAPQARLFPIFSHRYLVCVPAEASRVVLSIVDLDAIVYAHSLREYLQKEVLGNET